MKLTVVISAYNEERKIEDCLKSVKDVADEIVFIDNTSADKTVEIAKKYTDKIFIRKNNPMLNVNKNYGFSKATGDWILNLDSDERLTPELEKEIKVAIQKEKVDGYLIPRKNILFGKWIRHSIWWPDYQLRLFRPSRGKFAEVHVHELLEVDGVVEKLEHPMVHLNYETISQYLYKLEKIYTDSEVENIIRKNKKLNWFDAVRMPMEDFFKTYFLQQGYKDGLHGLVLSLLQGFYAVVVFAKVWEKQGFEEKELKLSEINSEFRRLGNQFQYWLLSSFIEETKSPAKKTLLKLQRKRLKV